jgi:hypothetical protein
MKKWKYELIAVVVLVGIGAGIWWFVATKDERALEAQFQQLVEIANRQQVEIAVIEQAARLQQLRQAAMQAQQRQQRELEQAIQFPVVPDPKDVNDNQ